MGVLHLRSAIADSVASFMLGSKLKDRYLAAEFEQADARDAKAIGTAAKARIMQLQHERAELEKERSDIEGKMGTLRARMDKAI